MNENNNPSDKEEKYVLTPEAQEAKLKPAKPIDYWLYMIIGTGFSLFNIWVMHLIENTGDLVWKLLSYFYIIFMLVAPALFFGNLKRPRGYGFIFGFIIGGAIEFIIGLTQGEEGELALFIGGYIFFVATSLLVIIFLVFKIWRSFDKLTYG